MSTEAKHNEELNKSIDSLLDQLFGEETVSKGSPLDLAQDNKTKADDAVKMAPSMQKDEARGAGRPRQISEVPQIDTDGKRQSEYDAGIAEEHKDDEPKETDQSPAIDQASDKGHMGKPSKAPESRPFKKSLELSEEELKEFEEFKKSKKEAADKVAKEQELRKAEFAKKEQEELVKSAVREATSKYAKENEELRKSFMETQALIKAMASQPRQSKSITDISALEKSVHPESGKQEAFTKGEILDAAFELAKSGKISDTVVAEIEMTNRVADPEARAKIEKFLETK